MAHTRTNDLPTHLAIWFQDRTRKMRERRERRRLYRRTRSELYAMSDRELSDIGIARIQIPDIARDAAGLT